MISTHTVYGAAEVVGVPGISGGAGDARGVDDGSGRQHRNSSRSTHTVYGASEVYGVPDSSGGAGDASGVGDSSGSQLRRDGMNMDDERATTVCTRMARTPSDNHRKKLLRMRKRQGSPG